MFSNHISVTIQNSSNEKPIKITQKTFILVDIEDTNGHELHLMSEAYISILLQLRLFFYNVILLNNYVSFESSIK